MMLWVVVHIWKQKSKNYQILQEDYILDLIYLFIYIERTPHSSTHLKPNIDSFASETGGYSNLC